LTHDWYILGTWLDALVYGTGWCMVDALVYGTGWCMVDALVYGTD
jgi:hypothetical protein